MTSMKANSPTLPPTPATMGPGRRNRSGPLPARGLKLGGLFTTLAVFAGSFGFASTHLYVTNAPLQPATVASIATPATTSATSASATAVPARTAALTSSVRTTTRTAVTTTKSS
jgi:hypothetical protein